MYVQCIYNKNYEGKLTVGKLYKGDIIKVKSIDNGWAKFKYNDQYRYVSANYVKEV